MLEAQAERPQEVVLRDHGKSNDGPTKQTTFKGKMSLSNALQFFLEREIHRYKNGEGAEGQQST